MIIQSNFSQITKAAKPSIQEGSTLPFMMQNISNKIWIRTFFGIIGIFSRNAATQVCDSQSHETCLTPTRLVPVSQWVQNWGSLLLPTWNRGRYIPIDTKLCPKVNFRDGANLCGSGQLAVIKSERENNYIRKMLNSVLPRTEETVWIGAYKHTEGLTTL